jgi:hypothetical protein
MDVVEPQFADSTVELIGTAIASSLIGLVGIKSKAGAATLALAFVKDFSRAKLGMIEITKLVINFVEKIVNYFRGTCLKLPSMKFIDSCSVEIDAFAAEVRLISYQFNSSTLPRTEGTYSQLLALLDVGKHLLKTIPKDKFTEASLRCIHEDCSSLKKIITDFEREDISLKGTRQEPVGVLFSGGPGVAKSIAMLYLSFIMARDGCSEEELKEFDLNPGAFIHSRKLENVFFDSLTNKVKVFTYDDFMQLRDGPGTASEAMEIIRVINTEEYSAHMAHLENKGNVYIRPKHVIATTNQTVLNSNAIVNVSAMKRRFGLSYIVAPKDEYTRDEDLQNDLWNRKIDHDKLPKSTIKGDIDKFVKGHRISDLRPEHLNYWEYNTITNKIGKCRSFADVVEAARNAELVKRKQFALHRENFRKLIKKYEKIFEEEVDTEELSDDFSYEPSDSSSDSDDGDRVDIRMEDSVTTNVSHRMDIEVLLIFDRNYIRYVIEKCNSKYVQTIDDVIDVLLDTYGFRRAKKMVTGGLRIDKHQKFVYRKKRKLPVRIWNKCKEIVECFLSFLPGWERVNRFVVKHRENIILILGFLAGSSFLITMAKWLYTWWTGKPAPQSFGFSDKMRSHKVNAKFVKDSKAVHQFLRADPQFGEDNSGLDLIASFVRRNCFKVDINTDEDKWNTFGSVTFLAGRIGIMPYHFIVKLLDGITEDPKRLKRLVKLSHNSSENSPDLLFTVEEILLGHKTGHLVDRDLCLVEFPKRFPERPSIIDRFCLRKDLDHNKRNLDVVLPNVTKDRGFYFGKGHRFMDSIGIKDKIPGYDYVLDETFTYDIPTQSGDCGTLMCILNASIAKRKIFGIHVAGNTHHGTGFAVVVTQEDILKDMDLFDTPIVTEEPDLILPQSSDLEFPMRFEILGKATPFPMRDTLSSLRKTLMYGKIEDNQLERAMLRKTLVNDVLIDPLMNAQMKYCKPDIYIDPDLIKQACDSYFAYCDWTQVHEVEKRIYTTEEAVYGLEYDMDFGSINSSSSAGYPMNVTGVRNLKKELFSQEYGSYDQKLLFEEVEVKVDEIIDKAKKGIRTFQLFSDNLKDEVRPLEKVEAGSTRLFSGCPFIYLVAFRRYFGAFSLWYMKNRITNGSAIGVNPYSQEWNAIAAQLIQKSPNNIGAGDEEKYDGSQKPVIHLVALDAINRWYDDGPIHALVRSILWMELYNSKHIIDGIIFEWLSSLPSGHPFTIIINTIYHHITARYNWLRAIGTLADFDENNYTIVLGDDILYSVTDEFTEQFNDLVFAEKCKELGLVYTSETKDGKMVARRSLTEVGFLKRSFVFDPRENLWIAPLELKSILKMVDWTKKKHPMLL